MTSSVQHIIAAAAVAATVAAAETPVEPAFSATPIRRPATVRRAKVAAAHAMAHADRALAVAALAVRHAGHDNYWTITCDSPHTLA
jgi:hypothetical protein